MQCGFGRVGTHFWGFETQAVVPDMVTLGKPIGNGFPMGAVIMSRALAQGFDNGMQYFATCGGCTASGAAGMPPFPVTVLCYQSMGIVCCNGCDTCIPHVLSHKPRNLC